MPGRRVGAAALAAAGIWLALSGRPAAQQPAATQATPAASISRAESIVDTLVARQFATLVAQFSATMKGMLPEEKLRGAWDGVLTQAGAFVRRSASRYEARGAFAAVVVPCEFERARVDVVVVFDPAGDIGGLQIRPAQPAVQYALPEYAVSANYVEREVTVGAGEWAVPGTLTLPVGRGPFPAVVLVHGSGPNDRDETFGPNKTFKDLALGLGSRGVAVLRYEKRTRAHAMKVASLKQFTVKEETIDDAVLAAALLRADPAIDRSRVFVLGHSLGGMVAPRIAAADPALAGIIVMAGAVRSLDQSILDQLRYLAEADGSVNEAEQRALDDAKKTQVAVAALTPADTEAGRGVSGAPASYWLDLKGYDPPAQAATLKTRILVLQGGRDYQVTVDDFEKWKAALSARPNAELKLYPALNHLFLPGAGRSLPAEYSVPGHVPVEVIGDIAAWIRK